MSSTHIFTENDIDLLSMYHTSSVDQHNTTNELPPPSPDIPSSGNEYDIISTMPHQNKNHHIQQHNNNNNILQQHHPPSVSGDTSKSMNKRFQSSSLSTVSLLNSIIQPNHTNQSISNHTSNIGSARSSSNNNNNNSTSDIKTEQYDQYTTTQSTISTLTPTTQYTSYSHITTPYIACICEFRQRGLIGLCLMDQIMNTMVLAQYNDNIVCNV